MSNDEKLSAIYDRTAGRCHVCRKKLAYGNYGRRGSRGAWHVEHSKPRANGGTDHSNNLFAACIACNLEKSTNTSRTARGWHGGSRAPLSRQGIQQRRQQNAVGGAIIGGTFGWAVAGVSGTLLLGLLGLLIGDGADPEK
jgi:hypothetical protein